MPLATSVLSLAGLLFSAIKDNRDKTWPVFFLTWILLGSITAGFTSNGIHNHYVYFVLIPCIFSFGYALTILDRKPLRKSVLIICAIMLVYQTTRADIFTEGRRDIPRTEKVVKTIHNAVHAEAFAFGLLASDSFADTHYRYFFKINGINALSPSSEAQLLFLVCEKAPCASEETIINKAETILKCDKYDCGIHPTLINLQNWNYIEKKEVAESTIFIFSKLLL